MSDAAIQIQNLVHRYAELIDLGDFDALGDCSVGPRSDPATTRRR